MTDNPNADARFDRQKYQKPAEVHFRDEKGTVVTYDHVDRDGAWLLTFDADENGGMPTWWPISAIKKVQRLPRVGTHTDGTQGGSAGSAVTEVDPDDTQEAYVDSMQEWFASAAGVNGFDPKIIDLSWGEADGEGGVIVNTEPFSGGYHENGDWQDKDHFDAEVETAKETVLKPRDEFEYFGEPDYLNFIAESDIDEVVG